MKGYVDHEDMVSKCNSLEGKLKDTFLDLLNSMEFKNKDKIFYSPLLGQLPPFFRYARRFESVGVINKLEKELYAIDNQETGFVPLALFRSILEHVLKIKEKIVEDFITNLKGEGTLDVNVQTHQF